MGTIQDKLSVLASTTESAESGLTNEQLDEEKKKVAVVDYKMVTFSLCGKDYAIDIMKVKEIAKAGRFTYVPNTLPFVLGVYNLRGDIIPIIDLRLFFNIEIPERDDNALENMLIVTVGEQTFGVVVDAIDKVVGIQKSTIQPPHPLFGDINIKYIYGVVEAERHLYILLDIDKIFGVRTPEEEREMAETATAQMKKRQAAAIAIQQQRTASPEGLPAQAVPEKKEVDLNFIADSLKNFKKFYLTDVNRDWVKERYAEWEKTRGEDKTQLQSDSDAELFLKPFYSRCNESWWTEDFAESVAKALPENSAKNIVVWNPGCGKGYESYSLACLLKKRYPNAKIKVYGHDVDLLSVSNAPLMNLTDQASADWYQPYTTKTVSGDFTFSKEIKDSVMFEYHDCVHTNNLPPIDIIFARDVLSFLSEDSQKTVLTDFNEKMKGNGVIIVGDNENIAIPGWNKKQSGSVAVYSK
ncbi:CheR family methyltransferase [Treponema sp.]|jgi:purine-binding chemotaxis protein CheW|uniref:CheR family methyltransferase n=1 Tax=Treponema sp. TaxID=166 RepID=UPI00257C6EB0|nr:CheR family methyltransferase [Treponema sp.]MBE6353422.1 chemotaxis protein CheW [Treponema sp.]